MLSRAQTSTGPALSLSMGLRPDGSEARGSTRGGERRGSRRPRMQRPTFRVVGVWGLRPAGGKGGAEAGGWRHKRGWKGTGLQDGAETP